MSTTDHEAATPTTDLEQLVQEATIAALQTLTELASDRSDLTLARKAAAEILRFAVRHSAAVAARPAPRQAMRTGSYRAARETLHETNGLAGLVDQLRTARATIEADSQFIADLELLKNEAAAAQLHENGADPHAMQPPTPRTPPHHPDAAPPKRHAPSELRS